jgi:hypothetical protein
MWMAMERALRILYSFKNIGYDSGLVPLSFGCFLGGRYSSFNRRARVVRIGSGGYLI